MYIFFTLLALTRILHPEPHLINTVVRHEFYVDVGAVVCQFLRDVATTFGGFTSTSNPYPIPKINPLNK